MGVDNSSLQTVSCPSRLTLSDSPQPLGNCQRRLTIRSHFSLLMLKNLYNTFCSRKWGHFTLSIYTLAKNWITIPGCPVMPPAIYKKLVKMSNPFASRICHRTDKLERYSQERSARNGMCTWEEAEVAALNRQECGPIRSRGRGMNQVKSSYRV